MNNFFPYSPPDQKRRAELKKMLMTSHQKLYAPEKTPLLSGWRLLFLLPTYGALLLFVSFGSLVGVKAFSPVAEIYGDLYGTPTRLAVATQDALASLSLAPAPTLPGLSKEETQSLSTSTDSKEKALLTSKIARSVDMNVREKLSVPSTGTVVIENNKTLHLQEKSSGHILLHWEEQYLSSGALPARYEIERRTDRRMAWTPLTSTEETTYEDHLEETTSHVYYKISIMDWQHTPLTYTLEADIPLTSVEQKAQIPTYLPEQTNTVSTPITSASKKEKTPAPEYDFKDATQPLLDFSLALSAKSQGTSSFSLRWSTPHVSGIKGYNIYRDNIKRNVSLVKSTSYTDTEVTSGKTYQYQIRVVGEDGKEMGKSEKLSKVLPLIPKGPTGLSISTSGSKILLHWTKVSVADLQGYRIIRKDLSNGQRQEFFSSTASFEDTSGTSGTSYSYTLTTLLSTGVASTESATSTITLP